MKRVLVSFIAVIAAIILFSLPLIFKFHMYKEQLMHMATSDVIPANNRISTVWCEKQELTMKSPFNAYLFTSIPEIRKHPLHRSFGIYHLELPNRSQKYWGFYLLKGSLVEISVCVRLYGAVMSFIKGTHNLHKCLMAHKTHVSSSLESLEDLESEAESDEQTSSISSSQGVVSNETDDFFVCRDASVHIPLQSSYRCTSSAKQIFDRKRIFTYRIDATDYYYFLFSSDTYLDILPNEFSVEFIFDRTNYIFETASLNCTNVTHCEFSLTLGSKENVLVQLPTVNGSWKEDVLSSTCNPRKGLFFLFFLGAGVVIFICAFQ